ncbi:hypothetical protein DOT_3028 [Desulfosporosinus sp. OT]|nr:hypothetical protein DOT_3028 [Desulfosporosinus sp. OT]
MSYLVKESTNKYMLLAQKLRLSFSSKIKAPPLPMREIQAALSITVSVGVS